MEYHYANLFLLILTLNFTTMLEIERGAIIKVDDTNGISIAKNYAVLIQGVPCGTLKENLTWFSKSKKPNIEEIKEIVFINPYIWSIRHLTSRLEEFNLLSTADKEETLNNLDEVTTYSPKN